MFHLDIPKTRQYDTGKVEVIARNSAGEGIATTLLEVVPRSDDYRNVLKNSPRRKYLAINSLNADKINTIYSLFNTRKLELHLYLIDTSTYLE